MHRRDLLKSLVASTLTAAVPSAFLVTHQNTAANTLNKATRIPWKNWSGNQICYPKHKLSPNNLEQLKETLSTSQGTVRVVGSGHSFSELIPTDDTLISIRRLNGIVHTDDVKKTATISAGTTLGETGPLLAKHHQALLNMPDVDHQTLAGAINTATHGTGRELGSLSSFVSALTLVTASGEALNCNANNHSELFNAAKVGLGSLGIITDITMQNTQPYNLKRDAFWLPIEETLSSADKLSRDNRHFEFFYFPFTGMTLIDTLNESNEAIQSAEEIDGNSGILDLKNARDYLSWSPKLRELIVGGYLKTQSSVSRVDKSYAIYANDRNVRFNEMEYHLPIDEGLPALREVISMIEKNFHDVFFPIECRYIKQDDAWLSPFYKRDSISIAVHRYFEEDHSALFNAIEPILQKYNGRPHWGKLNTFSAKQCREAYPHWQDFIDIRQQVDPQNRFLNSYLKQLFLKTEA